MIGSAPCAISTPISNPDSDSNCLTCKPDGWIAGNAGAEVGEAVEGHVRQSGASGTPTSRPRNIFSDHSKTRPSFLNCNCPREMDEAEGFKARMGLMDVASAVAAASLDSGTIVIAVSTLITSSSVLIEMGDISIPMVLTDPDPKTLKAVETGMLISAGSGRNRGSASETGMCTTPFCNATDSEV